jgi:hypothetical protein
MKSVVSALLFLLLTTFAFAQAPPQYAHDVVKGIGYEVALPADIVVNLSPTEDAAHGFALDLLRPGDQHEWDRMPLRYIAFNTRWDAGDMPTLDATINGMLRNMASLIPDEVQNQAPVRLMGKFPTKLGDLPAMRLVLEFTNAAKKPAIKQIVVAYRARRDASAIIYVASLTTTRLDFQQDVNLFAKLLAGFKLTAVE